MSYELSDEEIKALRRILEFEKEAEAYGEEVSWTWMDVAVLPRVVKSLEDKGLLRVVDKGPPKQYRLKDRKKAEKVLKERKIEVPEAPKIPLAVEKGKVEIPPDLFECIVGYDDIKKVILKSLKSDKPVHILFVGPPGSAKSLFLLELERLGAIFLTAGTSTRVGIRDTIFERLPRFLIIDELDKAINTLGMRLKEWYGLHFPELVKHANKIEDYCRYVLAVGRKDCLLYTSPSPRDRG